MADSTIAKAWREDLRAKIQTILISKLSPEDVKDDETRIKKILLQLSKENSTPDTNVIPEPPVSGKSAEVTKICQRSGDAHTYGNHRFEKPHHDYTWGIASAPADSPELTSAYSSRAYLLYRANKITECLKDIDRMQFNLYPDESKADLFALKAHCHEDQIRMYLKEHHNFEDQQISPYKKLDYNQALRNKDENDNYIPKLKKENSIIPGLSESLLLKFTKEAGRHIVAQRDIAPGEIIGVQKAYVSIVDYKMRYNYCWHCKKQTWCSLPCDNCANVVFCTEFCIGEAHKNYHSIECPIFSQMLDFGVVGPDVFLALRLTIIALKEAQFSIENLRSNLSSLDTKIENMKKGTFNCVIEPNKLSSVLGLSSGYAQDSHAQNSEILVNSIIIGYLLAKKIGILNKKTQENINNLFSNDKCIFLIGFVEKNIRIAKLNKSLLQISVHESKEFIRKNLCNVIVPGFSFFNHSCDKNFIRNIIGDHIVLTAVCPIKRGEEIVDNYYMSYYEISKEERQAYLLENFGFICNCRACVDDWQEENENGGNARTVWNRVVDLEQQARKLRTLVGQPSFKKKEFPKYLDQAAKIVSTCHKQLKRNSTVVIKAQDFFVEHLNCAGESYISLE